MYTNIVFFVASFGLAFLLIIGAVLAFAWIVLGSPFIRIGLSRLSDDCLCGC